MLADALGIAAFKNIFWSTETDLDKAQKTITVNGSFDEKVKTTVYHIKNHKIKI